MICDGLLHFIFFYLLGGNALKLDIKQNECVINIVFVLAQNYLINNSLQIRTRLFSLYVFIYI